MANEDMTFGWAIGLFEGEGCIARNGRNWSLVVCSTDLDVLQRFQTAVGFGSITGPHIRGKNKPSFYWRGSQRDDVDRFLRTALPLFGERRAARATEVILDIEAARTRPTYRREVSV